MVLLAWFYDIRASVSLIKTLRFFQIAGIRTRRNGDVERAREKQNSYAMTAKRMKKEAKASLFRKLKESTDGHSRSDDEKKKEKKRETRMKKREENRKT